MDKDLYINDFVRIKMNYVNHNNQINHYELENNDIQSFAKHLYKDIPTKYPKFFKMDLLSKFGFMCSEILFKNKVVDSNTSLIFANKSSCLATDLKYQKRITNEPFLSSPSIFVYTLPNIVLGEISIKNKITGENLFLIQDGFSPEIFLESLFLQNTLNKAETFLIAWLEVLENDVDVFCCYISSNNKQNSKHLQKNNLEDLYYNS